jgi:CTP synthase
MNEELRSKIALFCNVDVESVIQSIDASTIYEVPILMQEEKLDQVVLKKLNIKNSNKTEFKKWRTFVQKVKNPKDTVDIGLIGNTLNYKTHINQYLNHLFMQVLKMNLR